MDRLTQYIVEYKDDSNKYVLIAQNVQQIIKYAPRPLTRITWASKGQVIILDGEMIDNIAKSC